MPTSKTYTKEQMITFINEVLASCEVEGAHLPSAPEDQKCGYLLFKSIRDYILSH